MKQRLATLFLLLATVAIAKCDDVYTSKYDNIDVDEILHSERLLKNYMNCFLDKGRCTPVGQEVKDNLPEGLENGCEKCSPKQQKIGKKVLKFLIEEKRDYYDLLEAKYDPTGKYRKKYEEDLKKEGIKL